MNSLVFLSEYVSCQTAWSVDKFGSITTQFSHKGPKLEAGDINSEKTIPFCRALAYKALQEFVRAACPKRQPKGFTFPVTLQEKKVTSLRWFPSHNHPAPESCPPFAASSGRCCCCGQVWFAWQMTPMQTQQLTWPKGQQQQRGATVGFLRSGREVVSSRVKYTLWCRFKPLSPEGLASLL